MISIRLANSCGCPVSFCNNQVLTVIYTTDSLFKHNEKMVECRNINILLSRPLKEGVGVWQQANSSRSYIL